MQKAVIAILVGLAATPAFAQNFDAPQTPPDTVPPVIGHTPVAHAPRKSELIIRARITDESDVFAPSVSYRLAGQSERWRSVAMKSVEGEEDTYTAAIPGSDVTGDLEYFIEAFDALGNGPATVGRADAPLRVLATEELQTPVLVVERGGVPVGPIAVAGSGVLMTAVGAALWFTAAGRVEEIDAKYAAGQGRLPVDAEATRAAMGRSQIGSALMIAGGAAMAGGVAWFLVPTQGGGATAGVSGEF